MSNSSNWQGRGTNSYDTWKAALEIAYVDGKKEGIRLFAWWKDGVQYVGTCGKTLEEALKEVDDEK